MGTHSQPENSVSLTEPLSLNTLMAANDERSRFPYLDGLRGLAVLVVVFGHYTIFFPTLGPMLGSVAKSGVWLFFMLSSFLLTRQLTLVFASATTFENLLRYLARRALRILPMYYAVLAALLILPKFQHHMFGGNGFSLLNHALLLYPEGIFWAISVEFEYYLAIPLICLAFLLAVRLHPALGPALVIALIFGAFKAFRVAWIDIGFPVNFPHIVNYAHFFLLGSAIALLSLYKKFFSRWAGHLAFGLFVLGMAWQVFVLPLPFRDSLLAVIGIPIEWWHWMAHHSGQMISCGWILCGVLFSATLQRVFVSRFLCFMGKISFSLYCLHILPTAYLGEWVGSYGPTAAVLAFFLLSVALSVVTFYCIERPFMTMVGGPKGVRGIKSGA
jgi:peptidoglycan/LPS O-acetylase OafA/YrhL